MDNENMEAQEITEEDLAVFDDGWSEDGETVEADEPAADEAPAQAEEPAAEDEAESDETGEQQEAEEPAAEDQQEEGHQLFTLKHLGEDKQVSLEELTALAQKGMDYDHVRQERDELRGKPGMPEDYAQLQAKAGYLQEVAELAGGSVEQLVLRTRAQKMMQADSSLSEGDAILRAKAEYDSAMTPKAEAAQEAQPADAAAAEAEAQAHLRQFLETYPDVKAEEIPQEVWQDSFAHGGDLTGAYARYENRKLKTEIAQLKQSQQNKTRSTGSRKTAGAAASKDPFDEGWDS